MLLAGTELLAIPLSGVLLQGQVRLVIYIGAGGVLGVLCGALLIAAGTAAWLNPEHRVFYGITGIVLGIASFPASNLGGFFAGMLLAIAGGALAFAWCPDPPGGPAGQENPPAPRLEQRQAARPPGPGEQERRSPGHRVLAVAAILPCLVFCPPSPGPASPGSSPGIPAGSAAPRTPDVPRTPRSLRPPDPVPKAPARKEGNPAGRNNGRSGKAKQPVPSDGVVAPRPASVLTARSATMRRFGFTGVATLPVGGGGSEKTLEFTARSASLSAVTITVTQNGGSVVTRTSSLDFPAGMTLYATRLCGRVEGITPVLCFTPGTASQVMLKLASVLGKITPVTMTSVTGVQFMTAAASTRWGPFAMTSG